MIIDNSEKKKQISGSVPNKITWCIIINRFRLLVLNMIGWMGKEILSFRIKVEKYYWNNFKILKTIIKLIKNFEETFEHLK